MVAECGACVTTGGKVNAQIHLQMISIRAHHFPQLWALKLSHLQVQNYLILILVRARADGIFVASFFLDE